MLARLLVGAALLGQAAVPTPATTVYVTDWLTNQIAVVQNNTLVTTMDSADYRGVGGGPFQSAISPNGATLYLLGAYHTSTAGTGTKYFITEVDTATSKYSGRIRLGFQPDEFLLTPDGKQALIRDNARITAMNLRTGTPTYFTNLFPTDEALSPDGRMLYVSQKSGVLLAIDTAKDTVAATITTDRTGGEMAVAVSADSKQIYVLGNGQLHVVDAATHAITASIPMPGSSVGGNWFRQRLVVAPDGKELYAYSLRGTSYSVVDLATDTIINTVTPPKPVRALAFVPHGAFAFGAGTDTGYTIDVATGAIVATTTGLTGTSHGVTLTPDDTTAVVTDDPGSTVAEVNLATGATVATIGVGHDPTTVSIDRRGQAFVANQGDDTVSTVDIKAAKVIATVPSDFAEPFPIALSPDDRTAYVGGASSNVRIIDTTTNKPVGQVFGASGAAGVAFSRDGRRAYAASAFGVVSVIDPATRRVIATVGVGGSVLGMLVSPDGGRVYVGGGTGAVTVIDTATNTVSRTIPVGADQYPVTISRDGSTLYAGSYGTVDLVDTATGAVTGTIAISGRLFAVSPDGAALYTYDYQGIHEYSAATHALLATIPGSATNATMSSDGAHIYALGTNTLSTIDTATNTVTGSVTLGWSNQWTDLVAG